ncbi:MAG: hypothetical protein LIO78_00130 [Clostridiales bacterium]|nr:hypothetical protein [Clostridiales bacterium]
MKLFSKLIRRIPPFHNLYRRIDALKKENTVLKKKLSAAQEESAQQYKALMQRDEALEQQYKALKKQIDTNEKRCRELAEQERKDCAALRERITAVNKTAAERDKQNFQKLCKYREDSTWELNRMIEYYYLKGLEPSRYPDALKEWYFHNTGHELNLEHPRTYNEKIQWLKLYDSTPLKGRLADKYEVRDYVRKKSGRNTWCPSWASGTGWRTFPSTSCRSNMR